MKLQIRASSADDLETLITLQALCLRTTLADTYTPERLETLINAQSDWLRDAAGFYFVAEVAEVDGEIVGFSAASVGFSANSGLGGEVKGPYVHPDWTHRGIEATLLRLLEAAAIQKKIRVLHIVTPLKNAALYRLQGYQAQRISNWRRKNYEVIDSVPREFLEKRLLPEPVIFKWLAIAVALFFVLMGWHMYQIQSQYGSSEQIEVDPVIP